MPTAETTILTADDPRYPAARLSHLGPSREGLPPQIHTLGNLDLLLETKLALFCSTKCPGSLIIQTYDLAQRLRESAMSVIGGFHSPLERECLQVLIRGTQPVIVCPARGLNAARLPSEYQKPLEEGRLLLLSPFDEKERRATVDTALYRNRFVAALADAIFVAHAERGGKTEQFCREVFAWGKPLFTFESDANANFMALGAIPVKPNAALSWLNEDGFETADKHR